MATGTPPAEIAIDATLVRALLERQHPDLAALPLEGIDAGWDNAMYRLGDALAVRLPRRSVAAALMEKEQAWLPALAARLPLPVPAPATDLAAFWMLFDAPAERAAALKELGDASPATWARARGWAALFGVVLLETGLADHPRHAAMGAATLRRVASD